ncbi:MAG: FliH/SctL family protein [Candidatus Gastranaerophilales bacterium]
MIIKKKIKKEETIEEISIVEEHVDLSLSKKNDEDGIDLFDLENIDFTQRHERRTGSRRRGFRRIDDRNLISRAKDEANSIKEIASQDGYQEGLRNSKRDIEEIRENIKYFLNARQEVFEYIAPDILQLSVDIAQKIIKKEVQQDPMMIIEDIMAILKDVSKEERKIMLKVNSNQANMLKNVLPEKVEQIGLDAKIIVVGDDTISEGGCLLTTTNGVIDATIEAKSAVIIEALKGI